MGYRINPPPATATPAISTHIRAIRKSYLKDRKTLRLTFIKMDMFGPSIYPSIYDLPFVDHLHERPHPHRNLIQFLAHQKGNLHPVLTQPDVDIRDTSTEYIIDVELPGLTDKKAVKIEWTSSRSLLVEGNIDRPFVPDDKAVEEVLEKHETGTRGSNGEYISPEAKEPLKPTLVVAERKIGPFRRHFNFPVDVVMSALKARLDAGLLTIHLPKKHQSLEEKIQIPIE